MPNGLNGQGTMSEQASLFAASTGDDAWLDRMNAYDPTTRLGEAFLLNSLVSDVAVRATRLIPPAAMEQVGAWLAETLLSETGTPPQGTSVCERPGLSNEEVFGCLGLRPSDLPTVYSGWRLAIEVYVVIDDIVLILMDRGFVRYRRLAERDLAAILSGRVAPFVDFNDERLTGRVVALTAVPNRLAALGGLRGYRRALISAGEAMCELSSLWTRNADATSWSWHTEFVDDTCARVFGWDGLERIPLALAYQRSSSSDPGDDHKAEDKVEEPDCGCART